MTPEEFYESSEDFDSINSWTLAMYKLTMKFAKAYADKEIAELRATIERLEGEANKYQRELGLALQTIAKAERHAKG